MLGAEPELELGSSDFKSDAVFLLGTAWSCLLHPGNRGIAVSDRCQQWELPTVLFFGSNRPDSRVVNWYHGPQHRLVGKDSSLLINTMIPPALPKAPQEKMLL